MAESCAADHAIFRLNGTLVQERHIRFENVVYTSNLPAIMGLVARSYGISFVFEPHLRHHAARAAIDVYSVGQGRVVSDFVAADRRGSYLSSYARDYIDVVRSLHRSEGR
ncbi:MAG: hypothetical protein IKS21_04415 [Oscillospiraceae bacterium]|nr:hypothetical protein [Oscillospiraceae bacterium]